MQFYFVKYSKTMDYLVRVWHELANTCDLSGCYRLSHVRVDIVGNRYRMVAYPEACSSKLTLVEDTNNPEYAFKKYKIYEEKDWKVLGEPFFGVPR